MMAELSMMIYVGMIVEPVGVDPDGKGDIGSVDPDGNGTELTTQNVFMTSRHEWVFKTWLVDEKNLLKVFLDN